MKRIRKRTVIALLAASLLLGAAAPPALALWRFFLLDEIEEPPEWVGHPTAIRLANSARGVRFALRSVSKNRFDTGRTREPLLVMSERPGIDDQAGGGRTVRAPFLSTAMTRWHCSVLTIGARSGPGTW